MDRRDRFEELFRERLHNWECEPDSEQWKTLAGFLPLRPTRFSTRSIRRTAAIVTLLLLMGGGLLYDRLIPENSPEQNTTFYCGSYTNTTAYRNSYDGSNSRFTPPCSHSKTYLHNWKNDFNG